MDDLLGGIIDSVVDGVSSILENADAVVDSASDVVGNVSNSAIQALTDGNFNGADCDFSDLFDTVDTDESTISEVATADGIDSALSETESIQTNDNLDVSNEDVDTLQDRAKGIERSEHGNEISFGSKKMCPTRHGCTGATSCNYAYADYPG